MHTNGIQNKRHINVFMGDMENTDPSKSWNPNKNGKTNRTSLFAGNLNMPKNNRAEQKKAEAKKQAFKLVSDQFAKDSKIDDMLNERYLHQEELMNRADAAHKEINRIKGLKQDLKDAYGITDDSREQKDLELLQKSICEPFSLTKDEKARLQEMGSLTDYQKQALEYGTMEEVWQERAGDAMDAKNMESRIIAGIKIELSKSAPMVGVQKEAMEIMVQTGKEVISMLIADAVEQVDEKIEEAKEKAEEEKDTEEEKKLENENDAVPVDEDLQHKIDELDELERKIKSILNESLLTMEELKGIAVDVVY